MVDNIYIRIDNRMYNTKKEDYRFWLYRILKKIRVEKVPKGKVVLIPENYKDKRIKKQIEKYINSEKSMNIVYSKEIRDDIKWNNGLTNYTGKNLMKRLLYEILEYIYSINKNKMELDDIHVFANKYSKENLYIINELVEKFRTVNIIISNISKFKILERK